MAILAILLALSCLVWGLLLAISMKNQAEMRWELELLRSNSSGGWDQAWQELEQMQTEVQRHQMDLRGITELLCRTIEDSRKCPHGWHFFQHSCYFLSAVARGWGSAQNSCAAFGAHLVVISTESEQTFVMSKIQANNSYWMGLRDKEQRGRWAWITGETPNFGFWDVWAAEDSAEQHKGCGAMQPNGRWITEQCSKPHRWLCEKSWDC